ncbi:Autophagy-related protein 2 [Grifola frondosa]|uniref:Autophagy-related protein 2 n=1 Tax=Grifola frondosa TaxID=5627 RepID=A0A1C7MEL0_GRIFR|nr:Autophagy-related protein 2 [Grifola frondosa]
MSWWSPSWLPALPSIDFSLPSGIQRRFISFALRKFLGHLLKPGQLDTQQVDAQIGSGYVQVRDLELNNDAINAIISGLPIQLHDGSLGTVTARIPWPNPLTSTIGLSLESLHLTFYLAPNVSKPTRPLADNLAESVASIAETFIHEELSPREEATLRESFHPDLATSTHDFDESVPGGLDPFITDEEVNHSDAEPPGISIFATLIERLLARFEFNAVDTRITLVHPQHASFTIIIPEIRYGTESKTLNTPQTSEIKVGETEGETRSITLSGVTVTTRSLRPLSPQPLTTSPLSPHFQSSPVHYQPSPVIGLHPASPQRPSDAPSSPYSDSSDLDEETHLFMSRSIAVLHPRPLSPASSVESSMYQSAISTASASHAVDNLRADPESRSRTPSPGDHTNENLITPPASPPRLSPLLQRRLMIETTEIEDETLFAVPIPGSFASHPSQPSIPIPTGTNGRQEGHAKHEKVRVVLTMGAVACVLRARHIRSILDVTQLWSAHSPAATETPEVLQPRATQSVPSMLDEIEASLRIRGVVLLLLPSSETASSDSDGLSDFFERPLVPPRLAHGYVRMHLEGISASLSTALSVARAVGRTTLRGMSTTTTSLAITDISTFAFPTVSDSASAQSRSHFASPILITDPHLPSQYSSAHRHPVLSSTDASPLPVFDVVDWTHPEHRSATTKLSLWRTKPVHVPSHTSSQSHRMERSSPLGSAQTSPLQRGSSLPPASTSARGIHIVLPSSPGRLGLAGLSPSPGKSNEFQQKPHAPAIVVKTTIISYSSSKTGSNGASKVNVDVKLAPLHIFLDLDLISNRDTLEFLEEVTASDISTSSPAPGEGNTSEDGEYEGDLSEDVDHIPGSSSVPQRSRLREQEMERERERRRLERLVLEDLDLGFDYRQEPSETKAGQTSSRVKSWRKKRSRSKELQWAPVISVNVPILRVEIRTPSPPSCSHRSGAVVLDIHGLGFNGDPYVTESYPQTRMKTSAGQNTLLSADWRRVVLAYALVGESKASAVLSLGSLSVDDGTRGTMEGVPISPATPPTPRQSGPLAKPHVMLTRSDLSKPSPTSSSVQTLVISLDIPSIHVQFSKPLLDGLQLWADDLAQLLEAVFSDSATSDGDTEKACSRDASIIGSRYFAKMKAMGSRGSETESGKTSINSGPTAANNSRSETVVKVTLSEAALRLLLPRQSEGSDSLRPFDILASDVDVLVELKPEGRDETVITVGVMDLTVNETATSGSTMCFLSLTYPRSLVAAPRSAVKLRFTSLIVPETTAKESRVKVTLSGITCNVYPNFDWAIDLGRFVKAPPGAFESVVPSERTRISVKVVDSSIRAFAPICPGVLVPYIGELDFSTVIEGNSTETSFHLSVPTLSLLLIDDISTVPENPQATKASHSLTGLNGLAHWKEAGYALLAEINELDLRVIRNENTPVGDTRVTICRGDLRLHLCADTLTALTCFISDLTAAFRAPEAQPTPKKPRTEPANISERPPPPRGLLSSLDEHAFRQLPEVGAAPDMIIDDLPTNSDYLDESFGAAAGLRELSDDEFDEYDLESPATPSAVESAYQSSTTKFGGETIKMLRPEGLHIIEHHFDNLPPDPGDTSSSFGDTTVQVRLYGFAVTLFLYDGYDWARTRRIIEEEAKDMRRKLAKIRQLVASGQTPDPSVEETNALLFNSVYIGLEHNVDELEPGALIAAIDEELNEEVETSTQSSWQSLAPQPTSPPGRTSSGRSRPRRRRLHRSKGPSIEFRLLGVDAEVDTYVPDAALVSRTLATVKDVEILDHIKSSTWKKFLTALRSDSRGNVRESDSNMVRVELRSVRPVPGHPSEEARLRAKLLPLRLHVDQDALDFLKKFFSFKDPDSAPASASEPADEIFFQQAEVFPIDIKLDYKPRRVDYRALRDGKTIELMNFFHFDGAEMTLRHITLTGITGWPRFFDLLNDLWTPDVKATQLVDVISGVSPIRSVVNVGSGVADLVLLPIAQYKKDGRVVRGLQKGTTAFVKSTAMEAIKLGARLATGTQVILEQAEIVLGGQFKDQIMAEALQSSPFTDELGEQLGDDDDPRDLISKYADQPTNVKEGVQSAYKSLRRNLNSAAQTILAVPMEVYERSGNEGPVRAVVRAVPIAVLKPMIGASEAVSKTLLGLQNSLDPNIRHENEAKYKQR